MTDDFKYIGVDDLDIDLFESQYVVPEGMSYNSYVITDERVAVLDTVDPRCADEWLQHLDAALEGRTVDYLVVHHMEPDHAGSIALLAARYPEMRLVMSAAAARMLPNFFENEHFDGRIQTVKEGDQLSLGQHTLQFIAAPMVHWPEVMMSFDLASHTLYAADGFGKFGALQHETDDWACEARRYYFNICGKYGLQVQNVLKKAATLPIEAICPLHGPVLRGEALAEAVRLYNIWSKYEAESEGVVVAYASIHGGTAAAARRMAELLRAKGAKKVVVFDLSRADVAEVIEDAFRYPAMVLCAASYDAGVFPPMHDFLQHLATKNYQRRRIGLIENGSWAPSAAKTMRALLAQMKDIEIVEPTVTLRSRMKEADQPQMEQLAEAML